MEPRFRCALVFTGHIKQDHLLIPGMDGKGFSFATVQIRDIRVGRTKVNCVNGFLVNVNLAHIRPFGDNQTVIILNLDFYKVKAVGDTGCTEVIDFGNAFFEGCPNNAFPLDFLVINSICIKYLPFSNRTALVLPIKRNLNLFFRFKGTIQIDTVTILVLGIIQAVERENTQCKTGRKACD